MLNITKNIENGEAIISLEGRLDTVTAPELEAVVKEVVTEVHGLTLDFSGLEYVSSAGLRVLLSAHKAMSTKSGMKIRHVNDSISEIFEVTGFSDFLNVE
ncbi:MAG: STAS domain-containing protein [Clostridia bacterium]|nr:STAS domain-containing protein [Clostridia bacterium]